jgi:hypothetical protein
MLSNEDESTPDDSSWGLKGSCRDALVLPSVITQCLVAVHVTSLISLKYRYSLFLTRTDWSYYSDQLSLLKHQALPRLQI